ncbi:hypothetical protein Q5692_03385 [Microcoleus sp. C2C3]|uniref:hypothetical protein n=1 Tax=unclassified Microcoleus TaxID=2642155 RepID=UPI002FD38505
MVGWGASEMLHHCQQQARCLFHKECISCGTGILPVAQRLIEKATGKMPVPQRVYFLWNRPESLFLKGLLRTVQDIGCIKD